MELREILDQARDWLDDEVEPYLYPTAKLIRYANEGHDEACLRLRSLVETTLPAICTIALVEGQAEYPLHESVVVVRRAEYRPAGAGQIRRPLVRTTTDMLDRADPNWTQRTGLPEAIVQDLQRRKLRLSHIPTTWSLGSLHLTVWRKPLASEYLTHLRQSPLFDSSFHLRLAHWVCYRAFLKKDGEARDSAAAADHLAQFEAAFGPAITAQRLQELAVDPTGEIVNYFF
jgi:hypothetical protein